MKRVDVEIPIQCARCGTTALVPFPVLVIVTALTRWGQMRLYSSCHDVFWDASPSELRVISEHLGTKWLESRRKESGGGLASV